MDVCLVSIHSLSPLKLLRLDISGRREFRGPVYPIFWCVRSSYNAARSHFFYYTADAVLSSHLPTPLRGIAIGNGWQDARRQYPSYLDYSVKHGLIEENSEVKKFSSYVMRRQANWIVIVGVEKGQGGFSTLSGLFKQNN
jgi:Serine carboxypeptidase